jgi:hypothetical protein
MVTWVAPNTLHARVDVLPGAMLEGLAANDSMLGNCQSAPVVVDCPPGVSGIFIPESSPSGPRVTVRQEELTPIRPRARTNRSTNLTQIFISDLMTSTSTYADNIIVSPMALGGQVDRVVDSYG